MEKVRILEVKQSVFANNDAQAEKLREELKQKGIYLLNLMSSRKRQNHHPDPAD